MLHCLATSKPGGESSAGCHPPFPGYSPHGIPVLQAGLPGPSPCSTVEQCLSTAEHRPYPSPGSSSGITPAPRSRASLHPCSPHPRPPAGRCCHPHRARPFTRRRGAGWGGRQGPGKSPGMRHFESPVLFPCGLINTRRGWLVTHKLRCRALQVLLAWRKPAIKHWKRERKS